jgi:hypothetical protein
MIHHINRSAIKKDASEDQLEAALDRERTPA